MKYSDHLAEWLLQLGYDRCFFVGGGNIMHLIESISRRMPCNAVIHEVAAGIAAEYYNETSTSGRAFALVTAGPGITNIVSAIAGAFLESRELLVIGGQVKTADLAHGRVRQRGIQEVDGVSIVRPVCKSAVLLTECVSFHTFGSLALESRSGRKGPVFIEIPLDIQAREYTSESQSGELVEAYPLAKASDADVDSTVTLLRNAERPLFLLGGGLDRGAVSRMLDRLTSAGIPVATTWNGADRIASNHPVFVGRPNTWGQRSANLVLQQADLLIALGTRLGMQQTGFNWRGFLPGGKLVQVDIDSAELSKGHPRVDLTICADANDFLLRVLDGDLGNHRDWLSYARAVRDAIPPIEDVNVTRAGYISPYVFADELSRQCTQDDIIIPCSSGGAFTVMLQTFSQKQGQVLVTNKGLASMGYGLSGAIGASFRHPDRRVVLVEGDGGFAQNMQEIGTAKVNELNIKIFVFDDSGYASIRMTQRNYFGGRYVGCDTQTGLGLPQWDRLFKAWDVPTYRLGPGYASDPQFLGLFNNSGIAAFVVSIDPEQTYFPKIASHITESGAMVSNPLHLMTPDLSADLRANFSRYIS
jgi:acetolactate synthase I/II/III large subunit